MAKGNNNKKAKAKKNINIEQKNNPEVKGIIYISIGVLLGIAIYSNMAGALSVFSRKVIYNIFGVATFVIPMYLAYLGIGNIIYRGNIEFTRKFVGVTLVTLIIVVGCATGNLQVMDSQKGFGDTLKRVMIEGGLHGGLIGFLIAYPLSKLMGYIGVYIVLITLGSVGTIMLFDITLYDFILVMVEEFEKIKVGRKPEKRVKERNEIAEEDKGSIKDTILYDGQKERDEFLKGINNKIKILDFMKNSSIDDHNKGEITSREKNQNMFNIELADNEENHEDMKIQEPGGKRQSFNEACTIKEEKYGKKEKLDSDVKEVINKEIEESITEDKKVERIYNHPTVDLLNINSKMKLKAEDKKELIDNANRLEGILNDFGVDAKVVQVTKGPSVTRFEIQPSPGVKVSKIVNLQDDIALGLAASGVRMEAPIPGKAAIGIEVPNRKQTPVFLREVLDSKEFKKSGNKIDFALGKDIAGKCVVGDLSKMPHMLIAGATGSGKSVCINTLIVSILYKYSPEEVRLLMIDPKVVELSVYNGIPHLLIPVVTDPKKAAAALNWAVNEMTRRYKLFADSGVRNIESYNSLHEKGLIEEKLPYVVMIVDELADLMMACPNDVEDYICRLAQMARAAGMHLIIATQRPSVDVITGVIKANIPSRISFAVSSGVDSRTILDSTGAEKLLGRGDMLYCPIGENKPLRVQGAFISEEEVEKVVSFVKDRDTSVRYEDEIMEHIESGTQSNSTSSENGSDRDELLDEAIKVVVEYNQASTSFIQRKLRVGFNRASRIMDELEASGVISAKDGSKPRQVLVSKEELGAFE